ncbi:phosphate ABC transporter substrate-binding protein (PhoT family) [Panacagrimonas perspica]|uniref:Phosphate-binding protein n=1 Tax=Panacagrimonas perspica TaxID=381431 RepID=A0A4S3JZH4_9GAMM|nr:phosphate ABC transporter substrate-binding protein PstS family protein [Panacagrimonas perspica]TDU32881.1 phosphate ABC transporter substrate-binding protein (PhoT family) [Panacagrimonas perspica]THD00990.1 phosphate-binding protein [Panacagrimonas perspica]
MNFRKLALAIGVATAVSATPLFAAAVDPGLPEYKPASGVSGNFSSVGSDTLNNLMTLWAEQFKRYYPNVNIQIQGAGSSTAPPALTEGTANFGPMSRAMKDQEIQAFEQKYGYKPTGVGVAIDALAVFVNKDNAIKGLSIPQVDAIFSATRKCGAGKDAKRWSDVGVTGDLAPKAIQLYGRNSVSGTYGYFKEHALCKGDFKTGVNEQPGSASVVQSISTGLDAIGYSGIGYKTSGVRALPLAQKEGDPFIEATHENAISGKYPLSRVLFVYANKAPNKPLSPMEAEFFKMVLSKQGQEVVEKDGYVPLPEKVAAKFRTDLGIQ